MKNSKTNKVNRLLFSMYTENTGKHILDSGGAYGRNWERNQKLTLSKALKLPSVTHELNEYKKGNIELNYSINVFKYLVSANLEVDTICDKFNRINAKGKDNDFDGFYGTCLKAGEYLHSLGAKFNNSWNTYNNSAQLLSQVLQGCYVEINEQKYILLQMHGGCDVRGGYTDAKLFKFNQHHEEYLPITDVYGDIDGKQCENTYNGYSMTSEQGREIKIKKNSKINLYLINE